MNETRAREDLAFIKQTMELATRYSNLPVSGYLLVGCLALAGVGASYALLGERGAGRLAALETHEFLALGAIWLAVLLLAILGAAIASVRSARRAGRAAWNSLAARLFLSQVPLVAVSGALTLALAVNGQTQLVPALWLLQFGVIAFSFSHFTGWEHRVQGYLFLGVGLVALLWPAAAGLPMLAVGFGGIHLSMGIVRALRSRPR